MSLYVEPTTRVPGELITPPIWNQDMVENIKHFHDNLPTCRVYNNANISLAHNTLTALTFNTERWDTDTIHDLVTNPGRLTCKTAGKYLIFATAELQPSASYRYFLLGIRLNGVTTIARSGNYDAAPVATQANEIALATIYDLVVNDYVELIAFQFNGASGALNVQAMGNYSPEFGMHRVG